MVDFEKMAALTSFNHISQMGEFVETEEKVPIILQRKTEMMNPYDGEILFNQIVLDLKVSDVESASVKKGTRLALKGREYEIIKRLQGFQGSYTMSFLAKEVTPTEEEGGEE